VLEEDDDYEEKKENDTRKCGACHKRRQLKHPCCAQCKLRLCNSLDCARPSGWGHSVTIRCKKCHEKQTGEASALRERKDRHKKTRTIGGGRLKQ
jgi:hypothetical protein